jgi:hypothetical protein
MRHTVLCVSAALIVFGIATISAAADDRETCTGGDGHPIVDIIAACSRVIQRNPEDADAYFSRGSYRSSAFKLRRFFKPVTEDKDELDGAISDLNQAVLLNPRLADATYYYERGTAFVPMSQTTDLIMVSGMGMAVKPAASDAPVSHVA